MKDGRYGVKKPEKGNVTKGQPIRYTYLTNVKIKVSTSQEPLKKCVGEHTKNRKYWRRHGRVQTKYAGWREEPQEFLTAQECTPLYSSYFLTGAVGTLWHLHSGNGFYDDAIFNFWNMFTFTDILNINCGKLFKLINNLLVKLIMKKVIMSFALEN